MRMVKTHTFTICERDGFDETLSIIRRMAEEAILAGSQIRVEICRPETDIPPKAAHAACEYED